MYFPGKFESLPARHNKKDVQTLGFQKLFMFFLDRKVDLYTAGFPCKAFSRLRTFSLWLKDPEAQPFYGCVKNIKRLKPLVS